MKRETDISEHAAIAGVNAGMPQQLDFLQPDPSLPGGFRYEREMITLQMEDTLLSEIRTLPFKEFQFHGYVGKRRTVSFGWHYDFSHERIEPAVEIPVFLQSLREVVAVFAETEAKDWAQVLVTEYAAGAGIGWHRDKAVFGDVIGVSLGSSCQFRLRRKVGETWERFTIKAAARSAYLLSGAARTEWEHSIPAVETPRFSVTFRSLRHRRLASR